MQAKLTVGAADDPFEHEADRIADQVMALLRNPTVEPGEVSERVRPSGAAASEPAPEPAVPRVRRRIDSGGAGVEVGPEGGPISGELATRIRRSSGRGTPIESGLRGKLESAFNSDFSSVRIHADSELAPQIGAEAFTSGRDIHFAPGMYRPGEPGGQRLLSHELAHVVQQNGAIARKAVPDGASGVDVPAQVSSDRRSDVVRASFGKSIKKGFKSAKKAVKTVFGKADPKPDEETDDEFYNSLSHETKMENQRKVRGGGPGENPDYSNTRLWGAQPDRYVVTLAVAQDDPAWMKNVNALKTEALKTLAKSPKKVLGDLSNAQQMIVRQTLMRQGKLDGKTESEIDQLVKQFTKGIHHVGHTWVRLSTYVGDQLKELYSYGMWPQKLYSPSDNDEYGGYAGFFSAGPGEIRHPDLAHEGDETKAYKDYEVSAKSFDAALDLAIARYKSPPPYVLTGYNCTAFAREVVMAAGKSYPGSGLLPGMAYTPGDLYWAIMHEWARGKKGVRTNENEEEALQAIGKRQEVWEEAGIEDVKMSYYAAKGPDTSDVRKHKLFAGHTLRFGEDPRRTDQTVLLDKDMEVQVAVDDQFIGSLGVVPLRFGSFYWYVDVESFRRASAPAKPGNKPQQAPQAKQDDVSVVASPVIAWFNCSTQSVGMWKPTGEEIKTGVVRVEGNQIGATGRTVQAGNELMVEYVLGSVRAWMPAAWWQMYTDNAYPTGPVTVQKDEVDEIADQVEDDVDDAESSTEYIDEEPLSAMSSEELAKAHARAVDTLSDFAYVDLSTIASVIGRKGYGGVTEELLLVLLSGEGAEQRCQELADAVGASPEDFMATFGPQR